MPSAAPANVIAEILSLRLTNRSIAVSSWRCASSNLVVVFSANSDLQSLIDTPRFVGWLEMTAQPPLQFGTVALDPAPDCRVVRLQAALAEELFDIAEQERVPQVSAHSAKNQLGLGLSPLEDHRSDCLFHDLFSLPAAVGQSCTTTDAQSLFCWHVLLAYIGDCKSIQRPTRRRRDEFHHHRPRYRSRR